MSDKMSTDQLATSQNLKGCNVQVAVRCRPLNQEERKSSQPTVVTCDSENKSIKIAYGPAGKKIMKNFTFDKVFGMYSRQEEVFESVVRPIVEETLAGFNCTIFAYGQTGTGKTHTMEGNIHDKEEAGIVPRSVNYILEQLEGSGTEFTIRVSFLELYNEELQDLLNVSGDKKLKLCEDVKKGVVCQNLEEIAVLNANDIFEILQRGIQQRQTAETLCNKNSSRSHSIFTMKIMIKEYNIEGEEVVRNGQLNLVDLAGSECIGRSGAKNDRAREAGSINQSLLTLGRVITALVDHHGHVPYRDSKLTRLLQESLGGKAKTCIIATLSPSQSAVEESMSTLDYAYRAKNIKNQPTVNQKLTKKVVMKEYFAEIEQLRNQLIATREKNGVYLAPEDFYAMEAKIATQESQLTECESALKARNEEFRQVKQENEVLTESLEKVNADLQLTSQELADAKGTLDVVRTELHQSFVELKATEEVVREHAVTESELKRSVQQLNHAVEDKQADIQALMRKLEVLETQEEKRLHQNNSFTTSLSIKHCALQEKLHGLTTDTEKQSQMIEDGIQEMLSKGRKTCDSLKESISAALKVLIDEAKVSKESMKKSCQSMNQQLQSSEVVALKRIEGMSEELMAFFLESNSKMLDLQAAVNAQTKEVEKMKRSFQQHQDQMLSQMSVFSEQEAKHWQDLRASLQSLKESAQSSSREFLEKARKVEAENREVMQAKAREMQLAIANMFTDFLQTSQQLSERTLENSKSFVESQQSALDSQSTTLTNLNDSFHQNYLSHYQALSQGNQAAIEHFQMSSASLLSGNTQISAIGDNVTSLTGRKRKATEEEVRAMQEHTQEITKKTCVGIEELMNASEKILADVSSTTEKMNAQTSKDIEDFNVFLNKDGKELSQVIENHFHHVKEEYARETHSVHELKREVQSYHQEMKESTVKRSGRTPRKIREFPPLPVRETATQAKIKRDAKNSQALRDITYEAIHEELPRYQAAEMDVVVDATVEVNIPAPSTEVIPVLQRSLSRQLSSESVSSKSSGVEMEAVDIENSHPNKQTDIPTSSSLASSGSKIATRLTRSNSKSRNTSNISTRSRASSVTTTAPVDAPPVELDFN